LFCDVETFNLIHWIIIGTKVFWNSKNGKSGILSSRLSIITLAHPTPISLHSGNEHSSSQKHPWCIRWKEAWPNASLWIRGPHCMHSEIWCWKASLNFSCMWRWIWTPYICDYFPEPSNLLFPSPRGIK
jgi:hypothetical protein